MQTVFAHRLPPVERVDLGDRPFEILRRAIGDRDRVANVVPSGDWLRRHEPAVARRRRAVRHAIERVDAVVQQHAAQIGPRPSRRPASAARGACPAQVANGWKASRPAASRGRAQEAASVEVEIRGSLPSHSLFDPPARSFLRFPARDKSRLSHEVARLAAWPRRLLGRKLYRLRHADKIR